MRTTRVVAASSTINSEPSGEFTAAQPLLKPTRVWVDGE